ncbi:MAG: asparagine synthetase B, partial [Verrucomicrobia bacterium]|nr:asparagine synthetase B [Verrucomicrobiota bacterium]
MCGIAGFTMLSSRVDGPEARARAMADRLRPRGPDGEGYYVDEAVALAHRRLSIIDIEGGSQPMSADDGRYQIVFNGEIYNYIELRQLLE